MTRAKRILQALAGILGVVIAVALRSYVNVALKYTVITSLVFCALVVIVILIHCWIRGGDDDEDEDRHEETCWPGKQDRN